MHKLHFPGPKANVWFFLPKHYLITNNKVNTGAWGTIEDKIGAAWLMILFLSSKLIINNHIVK